MMFWIGVSVGVAASAIAIAVIVVIFDLRLPKTPGNNFGKKDDTYFG